jgi:hypothetical protein
VSLSRLNHRLPGRETHPDVVQGTTDGHHEIADTLLPQTDPVFAEAPALHTAIHLLDPPPVGERLMRRVLLQRQLLAARLRGRHADLALGQRARQTAQIRPQPPPRGPGRRGGLGHALILHAAATGGTEKENRAQGMDQ